jgi:hypothetical protein
VYGFGGIGCVSGNSGSAIGSSHRGMLRDCKGARRGETGCSVFWLQIPLYYGIGGILISGVAG